MYLVTTLAALTYRAEAECLTEILTLNTGRVGDMKTNIFQQGRAGSEDTINPNEEKGIKMMSPFT
jgi:hypothetical protein